MARGDIVKDDSGSHAVFTEQSSSASQMTAAKVKMDGIARLLDCAGQAADAVSAYTQTKMEEASRLIKIPKTECPDFLDQLSTTQNGPNHGPKSWSDIEDSVVPLERNLYGHPLAGLLWERQFRGSFAGAWMGTREQVPNWECLFRSSKTRIILDDFKLAVKKKNMAPMWKKFMNMLILTNQLHFLITYILDALNVNVNRTKQLVKNTE